MQGSARPSQVIIDLEDYKPPPGLSCMSRMQATLQWAISPAAWIPGYRAIRYHKEIWRVGGDPSTALSYFIQAFRTFRDSPADGDSQLCKDKLWLRGVRISGGSSSSARLFCFTPTGEWLDVVEVSFKRIVDEDFLTGDVKEGDEPQVWSRASIRCFSTGFCPTIVPLAPLWSTVLFFIPMGGRDPKTGEFLSNKRIASIQSQMARHGCTIEVERGNVCIC